MYEGRQRTFRAGYDRELTADLRFLLPIINQLQLQRNSFAELKKKAPEQDSDPVACSTLVQSSRVSRECLVAVAPFLFFLVSLVFVLR